MTTGERLGGQRADSGFFDETILTTLEGKGILYIIAAPDSAVATDYLSGHRLVGSGDRIGTDRVPLSGDGLDGSAPPDRGAPVGQAQTGAGQTVRTGSRN